MRLEVVIDGESIGRHDFKWQPQSGELIETEYGPAVVENFCHHVPDGRTQVLCKSTTPKRSRQRRQEQQVDTSASADNPADNPSFDEESEVQTEE